MAWTWRRIPHIPRIAPGTIVVTHWIGDLNSWVLDQILGRSPNWGHQLCQLSHGFFFELNPKKSCGFYHTMVFQKFPWFFLGETPNFPWISMIFLGETPIFHGKNHRKILRVSVSTSVEVRADPRAWHVGSVDFGDQLRGECGVQLGRRKRDPDLNRKSHRKTIGKTIGKP